MRIVEIVLGINTSKLVVASKSKSSYIIYFTISNKIVIYREPTIKAPKKMLVYSVLDIFTG